MPAGLFGITNDALDLVVNLLILFLVVLWLALIAWTYFDARRRIEDPVLVACGTAASLFPFLGTVVYSILRPPEFLSDRQERELEMRASQLRVRQLEEASCPNCEHPIERNFLRCPNCRARIKDPCESCGKPIDPRWMICPYCETPTRRAAAERRRAPKRRTKAPSGREQAAAKPPRARAASEARPSRGRPGSAETKPASARSPSAVEAGRAKPPPERSAPPASDGESTREPSPSRSGRPTRSSRGAAAPPQKRSGE